MRVVSFITEPGLIRRILDHLAPDRCPGKSNFLSFYLSTILFEGITEGSDEEPA